MGWSHWFLRCRPESASKQRLSPWAQREAKELLDAHGLLPFEPGRISSCHSVPGLFWYFFDGLYHFFGKMVGYFLGFLHYATIYYISSWFVETIFPRLIYWFSFVRTQDLKRLCFVRRWCGLNRWHWWKLPQCFTKVHIDLLHIMG